MLTRKAQFVCGNQDHLCMKTTLLLKGHFVTLIKIILHLISCVSEHVSFCLMIFVLLRAERLKGTEGQKLTKGDKKIGA